MQHAPSVDGVTLASLHSAKGLEWDAVFLVGLAEGTLPTTYAKTPDALEEERRLLYVGITRAREWLWMSYAGARVAGWSAAPAEPVPAGGPRPRPGGRRRAGAVPRSPKACRAVRRGVAAGSAAPRCSVAPNASSAGARPARPISTRSCSGG